MERLQATNPNQLPTGAHHYPLEKGYNDLELSVRLSHSCAPLFGTFFSKFFVFFVRPKYVCRKWHLKVVSNDIARL